MQIGIVMIHDIWTEGKAKHSATERAALLEKGVFVFDSYLHGTYLHHVTSRVLILVGVHCCSGCGVLRAQTDLFRPAQTVSSCDSGCR